MYARRLGVFHVRGNSGDDSRCRHRGKSAACCGPVYPGVGCGCYLVAQRFSCCVRSRRICSKAIRGVDAESVAARARRKHAAPGSPCVGAARHVRTRRQSVGQWCHALLAALAVPRHTWAPRLARLSSRVSAVRFAYAQTVWTASSSGRGRGCPCQLDRSAQRAGVDLLARRGS